MQFQVPQFIEVEDKIFGPLTFKQFIYVGGGLGACYLFWQILPVLLSAPLIVMTLALAAVLAFFKFNGRPFINGLEHGFYFLLRSKLYLWRNNESGRDQIATKKQMLESSQAQAKSLVHIPNLTDSKLHDLAWSLDIKERIADSENGDDNEEALQRLRNPFV